MRRFVARIDVKDTQGAVIDTIEVPVDYYPNRISLAPMDVVLSDDEAKDLSDDEIDALRSSTTICVYAKWIDLQGPVFHKVTGEMLVGEGEDIPLDPRIMQHVSTVVIGEIMRQLVAEVFPDSKPTRNERRRSHLGRVTPLRTNRE
ncbi:MAG: hypothetical protein AB7R89_13635 [Dehalococcoidia bacterium]